MENHHSSFVLFSELHDVFGILNAMLSHSCHYTIQDSIFREFLHCEKRLVVASPTSDLIVRFSSAINTNGSIHFIPHKVIETLLVKRKTACY